MAVARLKTFTAETLTPTDLNAEFDQLATNIPASASSSKPLSV